ncbi:potassium-transporting ATPase subunit KdpA [Pedobacter caeni]|uniref:Potassium-transporting ATPase potassium-binding subunit n=1 Tax=Pedobacter caeni TaxID=288992 RepID=A0A1M4UL31_9SPHI|nr:potassium-transporting ATPase subunit KdpA [Pedobacter caeni]SHE57365.1 K+-transporting ATPase ATPase A chain [Pedobacter caeni]
MIIDIIGSLILFSVVILLAWPLGKYMNKVYQHDFSRPGLLTKIELKIFRLIKVDSSVHMNIRQYLICFALLNTVWLLYGFTVLLTQGWFFLNPAGNPSMEWTLALHSVVSFITSTNQQHYSGETGSTYFSQIAVFTLLQFLSAAASLSVGVAIIRCLRKTSQGPGNFYVDFLRSCTRILLPLSLIAATFFMFRGMPMTFSRPDTVVSLQGDSTVVATGLVAAMIPIKELGSNGGGYFGTNNAHPFENPDSISYSIHYIIVLLLPMAFIFFIGYFLENRKFSNMIFGVMTLGLVLITIPIIWQEVNGNPMISKMGIDNSPGNMEGKEIRFGSYYTSFYSGENAVVPAGTITSMLDSYMPLSAIPMLTGMQVDGFFGGLGTGLINIFYYLIVAVFLGCQMIGRTPVLLGWKIGVVEMQVATGVAVLQIMIPLVLTAIACFVINETPGGNQTLGWLSNTGAHGFSTIFYEYVSATAGNGSGFESLGDNTAFWNLSTSIAMLSGRFVPIIGVLIIAAMISKRKYTESSAGVLKTETVTFGLFLFMVIILLNALSTLPVFALGPLQEYFRMNP